MGLLYRPIQAKESPFVNREEGNPLEIQRHFISDRSNDNRWGVSFQGARLEKWICRSNPLRQYPVLGVVIFIRMIVGYITHEVHAELTRIPHESGNR
jgi:hypothetical protein